MRSLNDVYNGGWRNSDVQKVQLESTESLVRCIKKVL